MTALNYPYLSGENVKTRTIVMTLIVCLAGAAACFAADVFAGTWKLNEAKSKIGAGAPKNSTVVYENMGDQVKVTVDGTGPDGKAAHNEWTGKFDGKDYPLTGDPSADARTYTKVNAHTLKMVHKKDGKVVGTGSVVVSANGKTRTVTNNTTDAKGKKISSVAVYDKQ
jgi:hypothetical protein